MLVRPLSRRSIVTCFLFTLALCAPRVHAATIWTDWTSASTGIPGSASGVAGAVGVSYYGELAGYVLDGTSTIWNPASSFVGGSVTNSPDAVGDELQLIGAPGLTNAISFATPVMNPVFAIWSLGQPGFQATFSFSSTPTLQAGGPNSIFGGSSISVAGSVVSGFEGNGVVEFTGLVSTIAWSNTEERYYSFTVGIPEATPIPEPSALLLSLAGCGFLTLLRAGRKRPD